MFGWPLLLPPLPPLLSSSSSLIFPDGIMQKSAHNAMRTYHLLCCVEQKMQAENTRRICTLSIGRKQSLKVANCEPSGGKICPSRRRKITKANRKSSIPPPISFPFRIIAKCHKFITPIVVPIPFFPAVECHSFSAKGRICFAMPMPEMRQRVWNPAVEGKDGEIGGREESEGKSLFPASLVGPFLFAQLRHQFLHQPRPLPPSFAFPFAPPPFPAPPSLSMRPPVAAIPPPFLMVAAMMAAAPRPFHAGAFGTTPTHNYGQSIIPQQLSAFNGSNRSFFPPYSIGIQTPNQCQKGEEGPLAKPTENCQNGEESEWSTKSAPTPNEMSGDKRAKKRNREKVAKNGQKGEGEREQRNAKKCNTNAKDNNNPIVQMVMSAVAEGTAATTAINLNTCAICGDQFRLTSDLVQHARTNHRQTSRYDRNGPRASIAEEVQRLSKE